MVKILMYSSVVFNAFLGLSISFFPGEFAGLFDIVVADKIQLLPMKGLGAAIFGFAVLNYFNRHSLLGGIYGKPVIFSNAVYHIIAGVQLLKSFSFDASYVIQVCTFIYLILAAGFISLNFKNPKALDDRKK